MHPILKLKCVGGRWQITQVNAIAVWYELAFQLWNIEIVCACMHACETEWVGLWIRVQFFADKEMFWAKFMNIYKLNLLYIMFYIMNNFWEE